MGHIPASKGPATVSRWVAVAVAAVAVGYLGAIGTPYISKLKNHDPAQFQEFVSLEIQSGRFLNVGRYEVSAAQWKTCVDEGYCRSRDKSRRDRLDHPATKVNWFDTQDFANWMSNKTGRNLRLPTMVEWMLIADDHKPIPKKKLFSDARLAWAADYDITAEPRIKTTRPAGEFGTNSLGLSDFKGNVWEWTSTECGSMDTAFLDNCQTGRIAMGEHLAVLSDLVSDPGNTSCGVGLPPANLGFRLVYEDA